jgi:hypothetical protein
MKKIYFLLVLLSCNTTYGMEEPEERSGMEIPREALTLYGKFVQQRKSCNFPVVYDDDTVMVLNRSVDDIIKTIPPEHPLFKTIMRRCLLGFKGLVNHKVFEKISNTSKFLVLTTLNNAIYLADEQFKQNLIDYFLYLESMSFKGLCCLKSNSLFASFNDEIKLVFAQKDGWCLLNALIEKYHNALIQFIKGIDDHIIEGFYSSLVINLYCRASEKLENRMFIKEALEIVEKAKSFIVPTPKGLLENKILTLEKRLRNTDVIEVIGDDGDNEMLGHNHIRNETAMQVHFLEEENDGLREIIDLTNYEEPEEITQPLSETNENARLTEIVENVLEKIQNGTVENTIRYLGFLSNSNSYYNFSVDTLLQLRAMQCFLINYSKLNCYNGNSNFETYMRGIEEIFKNMMRYTSSAFVVLCNFLIFNSLFKYYSVDVLSNKELKNLFAIKSWILNIFINSIERFVAMGDYKRAGELLNYISLTITSSGNFYDDDINKSNLITLQRFKEREWYKSLL